MANPTIIDNQVFIKPIQSGKDSYAYVCESDDMLFTNCAFDGTTGEWGFKTSLHFNLEFRNCIFKNGSERAFDAVRGGVFKFVDCKFKNDNCARSKTSHRFTLSKTCDVGMKAGVRDVSFERCEIDDVLLGDYSIYDQIDRPKTRRISFKDCINPSGGPIHVRGFHVSHQADMLKVENTKLVTFFWPAWCVQLYWWFNRKFGDKRVISPDQFVIHDMEKI